MTRRAVCRQAESHAQWQKDGATIARRIDADNVTRADSAAYRVVLTGRERRDQPRPLSGAANQTITFDQTQLPVVGNAPFTISARAITVNLVEHRHRDREREHAGDRV